MKKLIVLLLSLALSLALVACGTTPSDTDVQHTHTGTENSVESSSTASDNTEQSCNHNYIDATCTDAKRCSVCGEVIGEALGHNWEDATCETPKKCTKCGETTGEALGHNYTAANCTNAPKCTKCGKTTGTALGHTWEDATCTEAKKCTKCGTASGNAAGHTWEDATCTSPKTCSRCNKTNGNALGHTEIVDSAVTATCTKTGLTEGKHCSRCNTVFVKQTSTPMVSHNYHNGTCSVCKTKDPNYKTADILLGEYIQNNGTKQSNGKYLISKNHTSNSLTGVTQIIWDPNEKSLLFADQTASSTGIITTGVIFEYGAIKQRITVINEVTNSKFTGIGYIYTKNYTLTNEDVEWFNCECTYPALIDRNKRTGETALSLMMDNVNDMIKEASLGISLRELGFVEWFG